MSSISEINFDNYTVLGKNVEIKGDLQFQGRTHLYGKVEGSLKQLDESDLFIEEGSYVFGDINCHDLGLYGYVEGNIDSTGQVTIYSGGRLKGKINSKALKIFPGAMVEMDARVEE